MNLRSTLLDFLYPPKCVYCHRIMETSETTVCPRCRNALPETPEGDLLKGEFFTACAVPLYYEGVVKDSLHRFKFSRRREYAETYSRQMANRLQTAAFSWDILTWVPVSRKRLRQRGYDQCQLLAEALAHQLDCTAVPLLRKTRHTPAQSQTGTAEKRRANVSGAYRVINPADVAGKRILLIDDIVTTGATLSECARVLRFAGAAAVFCGAVARQRD